MIFGFLDFCFPVLAVLGPEMGPNRHSKKNQARNLPWRPVQGRFVQHSAFKTKCHGQKYDLGIFFFVLVLAVLSFQLSPDRPNFKSYCVLDPKLAVGTRPGPYRATFRLPKKVPPPKIRILFQLPITFS